jgi:hypothetical protein
MTQHIPKRLAWKDRVETRYLLVKEPAHTSIQPLQ